MEIEKIVLEVPEHNNSTSDVISNRVPAIFEAFRANRRSLPSGTYIHPVRQQDASIEHKSKLVLTIPYVDYKGQGQGLSTWKFQSG